MIFQQKIPSDNTQELMKVPVVKVVLTSHFVNGVKPETRSLIQKQKLEWEVAPLPELKHLPEHVEQLQISSKINQNHADSTARWPTSQTTIFDKVDVVNKKDTGKKECPIL